MEAIVPNIKPLSQTLAKSGLRPPGKFRAKTPLFRAVFSNLSNYRYVCLLVVFHGAELKINVLTPETAPFFHFQ